MAFAVHQPTLKPAENTEPQECEQEFFTIETLFPPESLPPIEFIPLKKIEHVEPFDMKKFEEIIKSNEFKRIIRDSHRFEYMKKNI